MRRSLVIAGAGGYGLELVTYLTDADWRVEGFVDDAVPTGSEVAGVPVLGRTDSTEHLSGPVIIAVGDAYARESIANRVALAGGHLVTFVHPTAYVAKSSQIGAGSIVCPFALVGSGATIGQNVSLNVYASVGHEATVGDHTVLSPYTSLLGRTKIGKCCYLATNTTVAPGVTIGARSKLTIGTAVMRDAPPGSMLVGNPAKGRVMFSVDPGD